MTKQQDIEFTVSELEKIIKGDKEDMIDSLANLITWLKTSYGVIKAPNSQREYERLVTKLCEAATR